jgi:hypothetical protein
MIFNTVTCTLTEEGFEKNERNTCTRASQFVRIKTLTDYFENNEWRFATAENILSAIPYD